MVLSPGPEKPTLIERFVGSFRLPYALGALIFTSLASAPVYALLRYLDTFNINWALSSIFANRPLSDNMWAAALLNSVFYSLQVFIALLGTRYLRTKLIAAEAALIPLCQRGEETVHEAFAHISSVKGEILASLALFIPIAPAAVSGAMQARGIPGLLIYVWVLPLWTFTFGTFTWTYLRSLWGLRRLGKEPLRLGSFFEDRMMGAKPIGTLSLAFTGAYLAVIGSVGMAFLTDPLAPLPLAPVAAILGLLGLGVLMFVLPLLGVHQQMLTAKGAAQRSIQSELSKFMSTPDDSLKPESALSDLRKIQRLNMVKEAANQIHTWPIDTRAIQRLVTIALSVTTVLIATFITRLIFPTK